MKNLTSIPATDSILEFQKAMHLKQWAAKDNIFVDFRRDRGVMVYRVIKTVCRTYESALAHVKFQQSLLAPTNEVRS